MKTVFFTLLAAVSGLFASQAWGEPPPPAGDVLTADNIEITGDIIQETGTSGKTKVTPITLENVIRLLGVQGSARELRYYYDATTNGYVIAPKSVGPIGLATPVATVVSLSATNAVGWPPTRHSAIYAGAETGLDGQVTGAGFQQTEITGGVVVNRTSVTLYGAPDGVTTIMRGSVLDIYYPSTGG